MSSKMKKVFCVLFVLFALNCRGANKELIDQGYIPDFLTIKSIASNENVQDNVRLLMFKILELLDVISKSEKIEGSLKDIEKAKRRINYLNSVLVSVEEAKNLDKIGRMPWLNKEGMADVQKAIEIIDAVKSADSPNKIKQIPEINEKINDIVNECENLKKSVEQANTLEAVKKIPGLNSEGIKDIQKQEDELTAIRSLTKSEDVQNNPTINSQLKTQISNLMAQNKAVRNANNVDKLYAIPGLNKKVIDFLSKEFEKYGKLWSAYKQLSEKYTVLEEKSNSIADDQEKSRRFLTRLLGALMRALIGFDYRSTSFDFAKSKKMKTIDKSAMVAASKISLSHMGGKEEDLYAIINEIQNIMKILINDKNWTIQAPLIKENLDKIKKISDTFNDDANLIKFNVGYAIDIVDNLINGAKRPPRDNVQNFGNTSIQTQS